MRSRTARLERTLGAATRFLDEMREEIARTARQEGGGVPPRLRCINERVGHATPEYRTLAIPVPDGVAGASPEILSGAIARFAAEKNPDCLILTLDLVFDAGSGGPGPVLVAEACDGSGTRLFWMQPYRVTEDGIAWDEPLDHGWRDPGEEEMILDAAFRVVQKAREKQRRGSGADGRGDVRGHVRRRESPVGRGGERDDARLPMAADGARGEAMGAPGRGGAAQE
ncbi:MAG: hypothetical protein JO040_02955 [Gemmatimonadetes bacterium]|nr:hypothetical protein [Gemmatimonadota bacterium]